MWRGPWQVGSPPQSWRPDKLPFKQTLTHQPVATVSVSLCWASADRSHSAVSLLHLISFSFAFFVSIHFFSLPLLLCALIFYWLAYSFFALLFTRVALHPLKIKQAAVVTYACLLSVEREQAVWIWIALAWMHKLGVLTVDSVILLVHIHSLNLWAFVMFLPAILFPRFQYFLFSLFNWI